MCCDINQDHALRQKTNKPTNKTERKKENNNKNTLILKKETMLEGGVVNKECISMRI